MGITIIFYIAIIIMSVVIHEVSHGYAAYFLGDHTAEYQGRLTLNPLKHLDPVGSILVPIVTSFAGFPFGWAKPVPFNPYNLKNQRWGELIVAAAGPISNFLLALVFGLIVRFIVPDPSSPVAVISLLIVVTNLSLGLFNLIPVPPLDGSKILFAFLPARLHAMRRSFEQYAMLFVFILIIIPQVSNILAYVVTFLASHLTGIPLNSLI